MKYNSHEIRRDGHIIINEETETGQIHTKLIEPNKPIPDEYLSEIEVDGNFEKYRTKENADAYETGQAELQPSPEELAEQEERRLLKEKREQAKAELKATPAPQSNPELAKRVEKLEFIMGIREDYTE